MIADQKLRVLHVNDVASVASELVKAARKQGLPWHLHRIPAGRGASVPVLAGRRLRDLLQFHRLARGADLVHVHYGPNGYYGVLSRRPFILHLHGSDIRRDINSAVLGPLMRFSLRRAAAVYYATPDLADFVTPLRPDAQYLPNPMPALLEKRTPVANRVFFNVRWDEAKGGAALLDIAKQLVAAGVEVRGVAWGEHQVAAADAGVELLPHLQRVEFHRELATASVVVGQQRAGALGMSDLEALSLGCPLVMNSTFEEAPVVHSTLENAAELTLALMRDPQRQDELAAAGPAWVGRTHAPREVVAQLLDTYREAARPR